MRFKNIQNNPDSSKFLSARISHYFLPNGCMSQMLRVYETKIRFSEKWLSGQRECVQSGVFEFF